MDTGIITINECKNDGSYLHLYFLDSASTWIAYGLSAFGLRLFVKSEGCMSLRGFSKKLQMPCTQVGEDTVPLLLQRAIVVRHISASYLLVRMPDAVDRSAYARWTDKLRGGEHPKFDEDIEISTPVSRYVPKDRFIPDGMSSFSRQVKRIGDCILAFVALIVFSPLFLICYIAVKQEDGGPAIFKQERIGRFGRPFNIYKFRSMRLDAEKFGPQLSHSGGDDDPRLTKVGRFLRAHHLDELPQLWNVFCGDMAFIGPRPERKFYIDQILEHDMRYVYLYQIRPGVTSYATLYNGYTDTMEKMLRRLEYDLYYLGHRSWWLDFKVLANTFGSILFGKKF